MNVAFWFAESHGQRLFLQLCDIFEKAHNFCGMSASTLVMQIRGSWKALTLISNASGQLQPLRETLMLCDDEYVCIMNTLNLWRSFWCWEGQGYGLQLIWRYENFTPHRKLCLYTHAKFNKLCCIEHFFLNIITWPGTEESKVPSIFRGTF